MNRQKHKLSRRILAVLLMAAMLITMLPSAMFAAPGGDGNSGGNDQGSTVTAQNSVTTDDGNIEEFSKSATRTGANTWDISMIVDPKNDIQTIPMDVVLVIDKSNSMKWGIYGENDHSKSRMEYVKSAAKNLVDQLAEVGNVNVGVVSFNYNDKVERQLTPLNQTFWNQTGHDLVNSAIENIRYDGQRDGGTDINDGLVAAEEVLNDGGAQNNKVVILLSDGDYSEDCNNPRQQANEMKKDGTTIYTIGFADQEGEGTLKAVASEGKFYQANNSTELNNVFSNIAEEIIAMVTDNVGDDVTIVDDTMAATVNQTPNENIVVDSDNKGFRWNPDDEEGLSGDETLNINYGVSLDKTAQQLWNENYQATVVLNEKATLSYRVGNKNQTPLNLESLKVDVDLAKLTVANDIDGQETPVEDSDQYIFVYDGNSFTWTEPANELQDATYTGSTIEFVGSEDVVVTDQTSYEPSVKGEYKLVHHYTTGLNGSDVTVQVVVDGQVTKEPLKYVDIIRSVGNEDYNKFDESGPDANGTLTYDFDYYAEDGFDCVDLDVRLTENAAADYVLQGVHSYQSYGEGGTSNVTPPEVGKDHGYIVDNVAANPDNDIDCTIYLRSKYSVKYHLNDEELTAGNYQGAYVDDNKYIETEDVENASTSKPEEQREFAWMDWKNSGGYATTLTLRDLPNVKDSTVSGWFLANDKATELSGTFNTVKPTLDTADGNADGVIHFYATSTANPKDLTAFNKEVVTSAVDGISGDYQYPEKEGDRYTLTVDEGTEVTLLYKITVEGNAGAKFDVTDKDAKLVKVITADVTIDDTTEDHFTGTIPSGGKVEFYVATDFGAVTADKELKNAASVSNTNGGDNPDDPDKEVTVPVDVTPVYDITSIDKFYISSKDDLTEQTASKIDMNQYAVPDKENGNVIIVPNDGTSVTLLYGITVRGTSGATFEVTDTGAELVTYQADEMIGDKAAISGANGVFTGTIPDDGELTFYVSKQFDKDDIKDGNLNNTAAITKGDVIPGKEDDEEIVPVATGYSLTYEANGGYFANDAAKTTATVGELNPAQYDLWSDAAGTIPVDENGEALAKPTHAQAAPPKDTVISDDALVDVELIGWTEEVPETVGQIYAAGEKYPKLTNTTTIEDDNVVVYAVWGYDENGDGVADATQVIVSPADMDIYTGGSGYESVVDGSGETELGTTENGLPTPGFYITLPYDIDQTLKNGSTAAVDLSGVLTFEYEDDQRNKRTWHIERYDKTDGNSSMAFEKYIYRILPATVDGEEIPIRLQFTNTANNNVVTSDDFTVQLNGLFRTFDMPIYPGDLQQDLVTASVTGVESGDSIDVGVGTGTLQVRGVTDQNTDTTPISVGAVPENITNITAQVDADTNFYINESDLEVANSGTVELLVDSNVADSNETLQNSAVEKFDTIDADHNVQMNYLDLVDTGNGNAVVTTGDSDTVTLYWPYPEGTDINTEFQIVHYDGLDRDDNGALASGKYENDMELYSVAEGNLENTPQGIKITVDSFSPFALFWEDDGSGDYNPPIWTPGGDGDGPSGLNTEDHFSYIVGYAEDYRTGEPTDDEDLWPVKPNNQITRAEVATIFYRLLEDEVRDEYDTTTNDFSDVTADSWYNQTVSTLARMGIVKGYEDGTFRPNAPITRAEFGAIATRFFAETGATYEPGTFTDVTGDEWYANAIQDAVNLGLIGGYPDGTVRPNNNITRAEACAIVNRTLGRVPDADHLLPEDVMKVWPDNNPTDWFYADMQEATNGHEYAWIEEDGHEIEEWTNLLDKDWTDR